jgi:hypothetical protein
MLNDGWPHEYSSSHEPPTPITKSIKQSVIAIATALAIPTALYLLSIWHYLMGELGFVLWGAVAFCPAAFAAFKIYEMMEKDGYHRWARLAVAAIIFWTIAIFLFLILGSHHLHSEEDSWMLPIPSVWGPGR